MKKRFNYKKANILLFIILFLLVGSIFVYRLLNPVPILEDQACNDRMNKIALKESIIKRETGKYVSDLKKLENDNKLHYYMKCPMSDEKYDIKVFGNGDSIEIFCRYHKKKIVNNIYRR